MPTTAARNSMKDRCSVVRATVPRANPFGGPLPSGVETIYSSLPCRAWAATETLIEDGVKVADVAIWKLRLPVDADVQVRDVVNGVASSSLEVLTVIARRASHIVVSAREVSGSDFPTGIKVLYQWTAGTLHYWSAGTGDWWAAD